MVDGTGSAGASGAVENAGESNGATAMDGGLWWELKYTGYFVKTIHTRWDPNLGWLGPMNG